MSQAQPFNIACVGDRVLIVKEKSETNKSQKMCGCYEKRYIEMRFQLLIVLVLSIHFLLYPTRR